MAKRQKTEVTHASTKQRVKPGSFCAIPPATPTFWSSLKRKERATIGIDVGEEAIYLTRLTFNRSSVDSIQCVQTPLDPTDHDDIPLLGGKLSAAFSQLCGSERKKVAVWGVLVTDRVDMRELHIPKLPPNQIANAVFWTAKKAFSFDENDVVFDFELRNPVQESGTEKLTVFAYTVPREDIRTIQQIFEAADIKLTGLTIPPFCNQNLVRLRWIPVREKVVANLHIGHRYSRIEVYEESQLILSRMLKAGMIGMENSLLEAVNEKLLEAPSSENSALDDATPRPTSFFNLDLEPLEDDSPAPQHTQSTRHAEQIEPPLELEIEPDNQDEPHELHPLTSPEDLEDKPRSAPLRRLRPENYDVPAPNDEELPSVLVLEDTPSLDNPPFDQPDPDIDEALHLELEPQTEAETFTPVPREMTSRDDEKPPIDEKADHAESSGLADELELLFDPTKTASQSSARKASEKKKHSLNNSPVETMSSPEDSTPNALMDLLEPPAPPVEEPDAESMEALDIPESPSASDEEDGDNAPPPPSDKAPQTTLKKEPEDNGIDSNTLILSLADERIGIPRSLAERGVDKTEIFDMAAPALERLLRQVEMTFKHYSVTLGHDPVRQMFVSGPLSSSRLLLEYFSDNLDMPVQNCDPLANRQAFHPSMLSPDLKASERNAFRLSTAAAVSNNVMTPNLLYTYKEKEKAAKINRANKTVLVACGLIFLILLGVFGWQIYSREEKQIQIVRLESELATLKKPVDINLLHKMALTATNDLNYVRLLAEKNQGTALLNEIFLLTPQNVRLSSISVQMGAPQDTAAQKSKDKASTARKNVGQAKKSKILVLDGFVLGALESQEAELAGYMAIVRQSELIEDCDISLTEKKRAPTGEDALRFVITAEIS
ncbi:hypothetical protein [Desulfovibrio inopinatus]|uniref:hypothetical protein n=1 Tax=Desulfovibrio inopinatus TaxID=102109 RepID=UPI0004190863|nr:hypothetical protein [Desulfovibrio inopinatus]